MKKISWLMVLLLASAFAAPSFAQTKGLGLGLYGQVGNTNERGGINAKLWLNANNAFDLSASIEPDPLFASAGFYASYLYHFWNVLPVSFMKIPLYFGPNGGVGVWDGGFALRGGVVGGIDFCFPTVPMDIYIQGNPAVEYKNYDNGDERGGLDLDFYLQIGLRFFVGG